MDENEFPQNASIAPMGIFNTGLAVVMTMSGSSRGQMSRELFFNGGEAIAAPGETERLVIIRAIKVADCRAHKLSFYNTGLGLTDDLMHKMTNLSFSSKATGVSGTLHKGEGAKVATLPFNKRGVRYRSRRDDLLMETVLVDHPVHGAGCLRLECEHADGSKTLESVYLADPISTDKFMDGDFVEVTLLGNSGDQNTILDPYGDGSTDYKIIGDEIFDRFYSFDFESFALPTRLFFEGKEFNAPTPIEMLPLKTFVEQNKNLYSHHDIVTLNNGIKIEFIYSPHAVSFPQKLTRGTSRLAYVWHNEMYDVHTGKNWTNAANDYAIYGVAANTTILVHLPDDYPVHATRYREKLKRNLEQTEVRCRDFVNEIFAARPQWLCDLGSSKKTRVSGGMEAQKKRLQSLLDTFASKPVPVSTATPPIVVAMPVSTLPATVGTGGSGPRTGGGGTRNNTNNGPRKAVQALPSKNGTARLAVPECLFENGHGNVDKLEHRCVYYAPGPVNTIYVNMASTAFQAFVGEVAREVVEDIMLVTDEVREAATDRIKSYLFYQLGSVVLRNLANKGKSEWQDQDIDMALSQESLQNVVYTCMDNYGLLARDIKNTLPIKTLRNEAKLKNSSASAEVTSLEERIRQSAEFKAAHGDIIPGLITVKKNPPKDPPLEASN